MPTQKKIWHQPAVSGYSHLQDSNASSASHVSDKVSPTCTDFGRDSEIRRIQCVKIKVIGCPTESETEMQLICVKSAFSCTLILLGHPVYAWYTEMRFILCTWFGEFCSCCSLTALPGPAWVLLNKICEELISSLYNGQGLNIKVSIDVSAIVGRDFPQSRGK